MSRKPASASAQLLGLWLHRHTLFVEPTLEGRVMAPLPSSLCLSHLTQPDSPRGSWWPQPITPALSEPRVGSCDLEEWLDLKTEEGTLSQGMQAPLGAGKGE